MKHRKHHFRGGRIGEEIKRVISDMLLRELKDPRFTGLVSVSAVKASDDGSFATVYVTMLGAGSGAMAEATDEEKEEALAAFENAKGLIRREIGRRLGLRHTPDLRFRFDTSEEYGRHIEKIIEELGIPKTLKEKPMNSIEEIAATFEAVETVRIFPHENMDGDTFGSSVALCLALRERGKDCSVVINEKIPDNIAFIEYGCSEFASDETTPDVDGRCDESDDGVLGASGTAAANTEARTAEFLAVGCDLAVLMDVGETARITGRERLFADGRKTICIDHHVSSRPVYDYNRIDTSASATGELIYDILRAMGVTPDARAATALYVGILTDTGRFQYTNTTPRALRIAAELLDLGVKPNEVSTEIYQNVRLEKLMLENAVMSTMETVADGKGAIVYMTRKMLGDSGAIEEETEGIAEKLRGIRGVEVSVFVRETEDGRTKGSMRSKHYYNIAELASRFGGGGHVRAAGFTSGKPLQDVVEEVKSALWKTL
ncbi:MAG: 30S ribosome-binding factor RbfA [Clostridiales Family XIII bacterium]|jgi:phosphoesterase RecJ-like protein|nr:30S ribosome-binding factor RbfA [Clostridiales Family XIII bacterium]